MTPDTSALTDEGLAAPSLLQRLTGSKTRLFLTESPEPSASLDPGSPFLAAILGRVASCPEVLSSGSIRTWLPHTCMVLSSIFSAFLALAVDILGKEGVSAGDQYVCSVVLQFPITLAAVVLQGEHVLGTGGEGRPRSALLLQGFLGAFCVIFYQIAVVGTHLAAATTIIYSEALVVPLVVAALGRGAFYFHDLAVVLVASMGVVCMTWAPGVSMTAILAAAGETTIFSVFLVVTRIWMPRENMWVAQNMKVMWGGFLYLIVMVPWYCHGQSCFESVRVLYSLFQVGGAMAGHTKVLILSSNVLMMLSTLLSQTSVQIAAPKQLAGVMLWHYLTPVLSCVLGSVVAKESLKENTQVGILCVALGILGHEVLPLWASHATGMGWISTKLFGHEEEEDEEEPLEYERLEETASWRLEETASWRLQPRHV
ncbi:unnamed protein product [Polarella glacialis]|uniref:EamA domain-containing protein n=1 Tax=Polarella glacialis TaxID=89957 RepID=A0A813LAU3_POLGL|nr:unnamed protein product [Polarella glacialis]